MQEATLPNVVSISYGWPEAGQCDVPGQSTYCSNDNAADYMNRTNTEFAKLGVMGTTMVVCSQDLGAPGEFNPDCSLDNTEYPMWPVYPGSSPYVLSVGSTAMSGSGNGIGLATVPHTAPEVTAPVCSKYNCSAETSEVACMLGNCIFTSGGGFSNYTTANGMPDWQSSAAQAYFSSGVPLPSKGFSREGRGYPDVGSIGQNVLIVQDGAVVVTGGTSASTPLWAGIVTLLNDHQLSKGKPTLGFLPPLLYKMANDQPNTFNAVLRGGNRCTEESCCKYGYLVAAKKGAGFWNPVTGLGSPNVANILTWLDANT
jgi:tripeptidyl-peptidase-1